MSCWALGAAAVVTLALVACDAAGLRSLVPYLLLGGALWVALLASGVRATIAGVILALANPARTPVNAAEFSARARALPPGSSAGSGVAAGRQWECRPSEGAGEG